MLGRLFTIMMSLLALLGAGLLSYTYWGGSTDNIVPVSTIQQVPLSVVSAPTATSTDSPVVKKPTVATKTTPSTSNGSLTPKVESPKEKAITPGPLRVITPTSTPVVATPVTQKTSPLPSQGLSVQGIIVYTNSARATNGSLPALTENKVLNLDAQMKLADMFTKQYFEHISPSGVGPSDLAKTVGYAYVLVGENLALGNFESDEEVVTAWMNSPGHRANILNGHYTEIGVAVGKGVYEGRETWIAVQSFGMPLSACPAISASLKSQIEANNTEIARLKTLLDEKKMLIDTTSQSDPNYNTYVAEFNAIVPEYNALIETNRASVILYNSQVQSFNDCANSAGGHTP